MLGTSTYVAHVVQPMLWILVILGVFSLPMTLSYWRNWFGSYRDRIIAAREEREAFERFKEQYRKEM